MIRYISDLQPGFFNKLKGLTIPEISDIRIYGSLIKNVSKINDLDIGILMNSDCNIKKIRNNILSLQQEDEFPVFDIMFWNEAIWNNRINELKSLNSSSYNIIKNSPYYSVLEDETYNFDFGDKIELPYLPFHFLYDVRTNIGQY